MFSDFDDIWANAAPVFDSVFAERMLVTPRRAGQYSSALDPSRPALEVKGIYDPKTVAVRGEGRMASIAAQSDRLEDRVVIDFPVAAFGNDSATWPAKGDRITLLDRLGQPVFEIAIQDVSGHGRIAFRCVRAVQ